MHQVDATNYHTITCCPSVLFFMLNKNTTSNTTQTTTLYYVLQTATLYYVLPIFCALLLQYKGDSRLAMTDLDEAMSLDTNCYLAFFNAGCIAARQRHYAKVCHHVCHFHCVHLCVCVRACVRACVRLLLSNHATGDSLVH